MWPHSVFDAVRFSVEPFHRAQSAMADLKSAVREVLASAEEPLTNAQIGRILGIYAGHLGHEGHISRTLLEFLKSEGVVEQDSATKRWSLVRHTSGD